LDEEEGTVRFSGVDRDAPFVDGLQGDVFTDRTLHRFRATALRGIVS
jgi:hypothetical protein